MTLTEILPSLRRSVPDPLAVHLWPAATVATTTDVLVGGVSLLHLAVLCDTPCVHTGDMVVPGLHGPALPRAAAVVVTTVVSVGVAPGGDLLVELDADLRAALPCWSEARLIGRASVARAAEVRLAPGSAGPDATVHLPGDVRDGDLLAVPCPADLTLSDVRGATAEGVRR